MPRRLPYLACLLVLSTLALAGCNGEQAEDAKPTIVAYVAHDARYSRKILDRFEKQTGITVRARFDTEATKSLGLTQQIKRERENPRADVFWNNQMLGTAELAHEGLLAPYKGAGYQRIPDRFRDSKGRFVGFAARVRVWIVNTEAMAAERATLRKRLRQDDLSRVAIAKPRFGTTLSHYAVLRDLWGPEKFRAWHRDWRDRGVVERGGNMQTADLVAAGTCDIGLTDSSDYFVVKERGASVDRLVVRAGEEDGEAPAQARPIVIPNSVAIVRGTEQRGAAEKLCDFLLSARVERLLAEGKAGQVPLGPVEAQKLPSRVRRLQKVVENGYPIAGLREQRAAALSFLKDEGA